MTQGAVCDDLGRALKDKDPSRSRLYRIYNTSTFRVVIQLFHSKIRLTQYNIDVNHVVHLRPSR